MSLEQLQEHEDHDADHKDPNLPDADAGEGDADLEARARRMGWRPLKEYRGDPKRWVDAETFIARGEEEMPVLRERLRKQDSVQADLQRKLETATAKINEMSDVMSEFREFASKGEQRAYEKAKRELEAKMNAAVGHADVEGFNEARRELEQLQAEAPKAKEERKTEPKKEERKPDAHPDGVAPEVKEWVDRNAWFRNDPVLNQVAQAIHTGLSQSDPNMPLAENLEEVTRQVKERFPDKFENSRRDSAPRLTTPRGDGGPRKPKGKSYADLPAEAKRACDKFVKTIPGYKAEDYVKDYFSGEE